MKRRSQSIPTHPNKSSTERYVYTPSRNDLRVESWHAGDIERARRKSGPVKVYSQEEIKELQRLRNA